jgi:GcrA cell cycle regulator
MSVTDIEWTDADIARLKMLWVEGHSTAEVGRRMQRSKNSVVGKAHRLDLPARPSPIKPRTGNVAPPKRLAAKAVTISHLASATAEPDVSDRPRAVLTVVETRQAVPIYVGRSEQCCWPVRTVKTVTGRERHILCDEPTIGGRNNPYCAKHRAASVDARANARVRGHRTSAVAPVTVHTSLPQWSDDATRALR